MLEWFFASSCEISGTAEEVVCKYPSSINSVSDSTVLSPSNSYFFPSLIKMTVG